VRTQRVLSISFRGIHVFGGLVLLSFVAIVFKLLHVITWSWWWITMPLWAGLAVLWGLFIVFFLLVLIAEMSR
jgi:hypothetical protein